MAYVNSYLQVKQVRTVALAAGEMGLAGLVHAV